MSQRLRSERGTQLVEMAILAPFLVVLMLGSTDFARASYHAITLANAARAGAQFATQNSAAAANAVGIRSAAEFEAQNIGAITVVSSIFCRCPGSTVVVSCTVGACAGGAGKELYTSVTASQIFLTLAPYPGVPSSIPMSRNATMRVQ